MLVRLGCPEETCGRRRAGPVAGFQLGYIGGVHEKPSSGPQDEFPAPAAPLRLRSQRHHANRRMHQPGRGRRFAPAYHDRQRTGRFSESCRALQVMRGR